MIFVFLTFRLYGGTAVRIGGRQASNMAHIPAGLFVFYWYALRLVRVQVPAVLVKCQTDCDHFSVYRGNLQQHNYLLYSLLYSLLGTAQNTQQSAVVSSGITLHFFNILSYSCTIHTWATRRGCARPACLLLALIQ